MLSFLLNAPRRLRKNENAPRCCILSTRMSSDGDYTAVSIVPTGVGARIGGYAGDALPANRLLSSVVDVLITHPNVLNGALMYWPISNALYVEGYTLDKFARGGCGLSPLSNMSNKIGLLLDCAMDSDAIIRHLQAAEAARATLGLRVTEYAVTDTPLGVCLSAGESGASWGCVQRPDALLRGAQDLVDAGCDAIAIVGKFPDDEDEEKLAEYRAGNGVDAIAGAEAVISHLVSRELGVPCAHAPALPPLDVDDSVAPKAAAEELGYTFLTCVLVGLSRAPRIRDTERPTVKAAIGPIITADDVDALIVPSNCFGGSATMSLASRPDMLVLSVQDNSTVMNIEPEAIGLPKERVHIAKSYAEAAGLLAAHRAGIDLDAITSNVPRIRYRQQLKCSALNNIVRIKQST